MAVAELEWSMANLTTQSFSHGCVAHFVDWIRTPDDCEETIRGQADEIRDRIKGQAKDDGLTVVSTPASGSSAKRTGLRRHLRGESVVEGQDVDVAFVVSPITIDGEILDELLGRFGKYAAASYPRTTRRRTKSSIRLEFADTKLAYDLVPMLSVAGKTEEQILLRSDGERRRTSVQKHTAFVRSRTERSEKSPGRVKFNECERLLKWWREFRQVESHVITEVPTILIELLAAKAFDNEGVMPTYTETLARWFSWLAHAVRMREMIDFTDFRGAGTEISGAIWTVLDPVNAANNVVPKSWSNLQISELADWFASGRDQLARTITCDLQGDETRCLDLLADLFGSPIRHHHEEE